MSCKKKRITIIYYNFKYIDIVYIYLSSKKIYFKEIKKYVYLK